MKQSIRILSILILCIVIFATFSVVAYAALPEADAEPLYENIATGAVTLGFSDNVGTATGVATKKAGTISMSGVLDVYKYENGSWVHVASNAKTTTRNTLAVDVEFVAVSNAQYKAVFTITAVDGECTEVESVETTKTND